ncbi:hypothetical protein NA57DRAFT_78091 [Rhizodiscina lignyota]|uniref:Uncharacterized protein n=1 Tax=Rhizodiscina lignyota TaxID=1504668 RepID=A0A9P4IB61_9PEZI|nr:hypothetical protein NA57DRAFT_78091 [Rhizodiscina lignyota]
MADQPDPSAPGSNAPDVRSDGHKSAPWLPPWTYSHPSSSSTPGLYGSRHHLVPPFVEDQNGAHPAREPPNAGRLNPLASEFNGQSTVPGLSHSNSQTVNAQAEFTSTSASFYPPPSSPPLVDGTNGFHPAREPTNIRRLDSLAASFNGLSIDQPTFQHANAQVESTSTRTTPSDDLAHSSQRSSVETKHRAHTTRESINAGRRNPLAAEFNSQEGIFQAALGPPLPPLISFLQSTAGIDDISASLEVMRPLIAVLILELDPYILRTTDTQARMDELYTTYLRGMDVLRDLKRKFMAFGNERNVISHQLWLWYHLNSKAKWMLERQMVELAWRVMEMEECFTELGEQLVLLNCEGREREECVHRIAALVNQTCTKIVLLRGVNQMLAELFRNVQPRQHLRQSVSEASTDDEASPHCIDPALLEYGPADSPPFLRLPV